MYKNIFEAVSQGNLEAVKRFIDEDGADLNEKNSENDTVAHVAAKAYDLEILEYLLKKNPTFLSKKGKEDLTLLEIAIGMNSLAMVQFLVEDCKANIYDQVNANEHSSSFVHLTAEVCMLQIFKYFIQKMKVDVNLKDTWGHPLAFSAARGACLDIVKFIVEECEADVTQTDNLGRNILCQSAVPCDLTVPKYLLDERKLPINTDNSLIIQDALVFADRFKSNKIEEFVKYFVEDKHMDLNRGVNGFPLHQAAELGKLSMVKYLVKHGSDVGRKNLHGKTPLEVATDEAVKEYLKEMERGRSRRSLPLVSRHDVSSWMHKMADMSGASSLLDYHSESVNSEKLAYTNSSDIYNILALASTYIVSRSNARQPIPSPQDTIRSRIDPVAIEAVRHYYSHLPAE